MQQIKGFPINPTPRTWVRGCDNSGPNCVEAKTDGDTVLVRDSKDPDGPVLRFTRDEWTAFTGGVRAGRFDF